MPKGQMPAALKRYWAKKRRAKTQHRRRSPAAVEVADYLRREKRKVKRVARRAHVAGGGACSHVTARQVVSNVRGLFWCPRCGALHANGHWTSPRG